MTRDERRAAVRECMRTFPGFCRLLQVVHYETGRLIPMALTGLQRAYARDRTLRDLVLKGRKVYFTTLELARDLYVFLTRPGANVLVFCQTQERRETYLEMNRIMQRFVESLRPNVDLSGLRSAEGRWELPSRNASMTLLQAARSENVARRGARGVAHVSRLHASEIAVWEQGQEIISNIIAGMPDDGEITLESTPHGASGYFHDEWQKAVGGGETRFTAQFFPWFLHDDYRVELDPGEVFKPGGRLAEIEERLLAEGVTPEQLKWYRGRFLALSGDLRKLQQEYPSDPESCWLASGEQYVPTPVIEACVSYDPVPAYIEGETYFGVDFGRHNHTTEVFVWRRDRHGHLWQVDLRTFRDCPWDEQMAGILQCYADWRPRRVALDKTGIGSMPAETLEKVLGKQTVEQVAFTEELKEVLATGAYACLAERACTLQDDPEVIRDTRMVKRLVSDKGRVSYDAPATKDGHADKFWAMALGIYASGFVRRGGRGRTEYGLGDFSRGTA